MPPVVEGVSNFREFGGHLTACGGRVVGGRFFRSASPGGITAAGMKELSRQGVRLVVDLRGTAERARSLAHFDPHHIVVHPAPVEPKASVELREMLASGRARSADTRAMMIRSYRGYVTEAAAAFGTALVAMLDRSEGAVLVHCTAGKDRTGFVVAVIQAALGVAKETIFDDYLATNRLWDRASAAGHLPLDADAIEPVLVADADYLEAAFDEIDRHDGDPLAFIARATAGRVVPAHLKALIDRR